MQKVTLSNDHVRAEFQPGWGGLFSRLQFNHPTSGWVDAFVTENQKPSSGNGIPFFGCFLMVPFANRLFDGVMPSDRGSHPFPIHLKPENLAIHGTGWNQAWDVTEATENTVTMIHSWINKDSSYAFDAQLVARIEESSIDTKLILTNKADFALPMGMGFHPWFSDINHSEVRFDADLLANRESPWSKYPTADFAKLPAHFTPGHYDGLDSTFDGWNRRVQIQLRSKALQLDVAASGAVDRMHAFVMGDNDRFCLEPVSHKPGDLKDSSCLVEAGQSISGSMVLTGTAI